MTLKELAMQYYHDVEMLTEQINSYRERSKNFTGANLHSANRYLCCLYEMRREAQNTAETLEHYYENVTGSRIYHKHQKEIG